jgi:signal transduction histidine kinase
MTIARTADIERRRISEELHDSIGPGIAAVGLNLHIIEHKIGPGGDAELLQLLRESQALLSQAVAEIRELSGELRPARLEYAGLEAALADFAQQYRRRTGIETRFTVALADAPDASPRLDAALEWLLYRVIQEALGNCARHASAGRVLVDLHRKDDIVVLQISDDGVGFTPEALAAADKCPGLGLLEMRERIEAVQGRFSLSSRPGHGTHILATVPLAGAGKPGAEPGAKPGAG